MEEKRGPGRPRTAAREEPREQRRRQAGHAGYGRMKLNHKRAANFEYYWSRPGKLEERTVLDDWNHVTWDEIGGRDMLGDISIAQEQLPGEHVTRRVGETAQGKAEVHYLLKKKKEYWEADQLERTRSNEEVINQIMGGGDVERAHGQGVTVRRRGA